MNALSYDCGLAFCSLFSNRASLSPSPKHSTAIRETNRLPTFLGLAQTSFPDYHPRWRRVKLGRY